MNTFNIQINFQFFRFTRPYQPIRSSRPRPTPEPVFIENIVIRDLYTSVDNVSHSFDDNLQRAQNAFVTSTQKPLRETSFLRDSKKKWSSQENLTKQTVNQQHRHASKSQNNQPKQTIYMNSNKTIHMSMEKMLTLAGYNNHNNNNMKADDRLPVVELKPFLSSTNKEWIPAKSRAWEEEMGVGSHQHPQMINRTRSYELLSCSEYPDPQKLDTPRPMDGVCAKAFPVGGERKSVHPKSREVAEGTVIQREVSFVPKPEREKTTTEDIRQHALYNQYPPFSFISRELTEYDVKRQQTIRVKGNKMDKLPPENNMYMNTWQQYKSSSSIKPKTNVKPQERPVNNIENSYLDGGIYDSFDRSVTLPSITVRPAGSGHGFVRQANNNHKPGYRLGVINSLDVMSMCGKPLKIEQTLTNHLKVTLRQLKRTKDSTFMQNSPVITRERSIYNKKNDSVGAPTIGEISIREARKSNSCLSGSHSAPVKRAKSHSKSRSDHQSRATSYLYDSGFEENSNDRKSVPCASPTKSLNRNSRMQMNDAINEDVTMGDDDEIDREGDSKKQENDQPERPTTSPVNEQVRYNKLTLCHNDPFTGHQYIVSYGKGPIICNINF